MLLCLMDWMRFQSVPVHSPAKRAPSPTSDLLRSSYVPKAHPILSAPLFVQDSGSSESEDLVTMQGLLLPF